LVSLPHNEDETSYQTTKQILLIIWFYKKDKCLRIAG
jgi:hypothetical protein